MIRSSSKTILLLAFAFLIFFSASASAEITASDDGSFTVKYTEAQKGQEYTLLLLEDASEELPPGSNALIGNSLLYVDQCTALGRTVVFSSIKPKSDMYIAAFISSPALDEPVFVGSYSSVAFGDVDGNSKVEIKDAVIVCRYLASLRTLGSNQKLAADANLDRKLDVRDVVTICRYLSQSITKLPKKS